MVRLIVFDFDGTLGDTKKNIVKTMQETMRRKGYPVPSEATIASTIGLPLDEYKAQLKPQAFPGVKEELEKLKAAGIPMCVASSRLSISLNAFVHDMGLGEYIDYVLGVDFQRKPKPNPEPVLQCLEHFGIEAKDALVVGDMYVDIEMGRNAGARTCGVTWGNGSREQLAAAGADFIIDQMDELSSIALR